ncbi:hypothetical protein ILYODFUR_036436, partial [Ilyodon furcidens]
EKYCELWCHSCRLGGARSVSFSADGHTVVTTGFKDGSLQCANLRPSCRIKDAYNEKDNYFTQYHQAMSLSLQIAFNSENPILLTLPVWGQEAPVSCKKTEENEVGCVATIDVMEQDKSYLPTPLNSTWLESRQDAIVKEDIKQHSETKKALRETVRELRET